MPKRKIDEEEDWRRDGEILPSDGMEEIESEDIYGELQEEHYGGEEMEGEVECNDEVFGEENVRNEVGERKRRGQEEDICDVEEILKAGEVGKEILEKEFFRMKVMQRFVQFFNEFGGRKYVRRIREMCSENLESIEVSYLDVETGSKELLRLLNRHAEWCIGVMDTALEEVVRMYFPNYHVIKQKVHVRIVDLPVVEGIRSLRNNHLGKLVKVCGVVTRRSGVFPLYSIVKFSCLRCKAVFGPFVSSQFKPSQCFECQSKGPFSVNTTETVYKDFQKLTIQEIPGTVRAGMLPRSKEVLLFYDLIDCARPGEEIEIVGIYKNGFNVSLNIRNGFPVFFTVIEASSVRKRAGLTSVPEEDEEEVRRMGRHPEIKKIVVNSISPSIYGHREIKRAIALAMFGGVARESPEHRIRGDINVLLLGDPGMGKSQFLRYVEGASHKAVLATGQGASSVGLTASVRKDPVVGEWTLEGGALVLADRGVCLIDEFDKMNEHDRTSIHEAMEQQSISISKAGIVATLHARCSVIAAANPVRGRYNGMLTFSQNVNLSDPIISRFDILCVVRDVIDAGEDERIAKFVVGSHGCSGSSVDGVKGFDSGRMMMSQELLRKYVMYARARIVPEFKNVDMEKISSLYAELRRESASSGLPITARHVESIVRISEAYARMRLSSAVSREDVDDAIEVVLDSFMGGQKCSVAKSMRRVFMKYFGRNGMDVLLYLLREMFNEKMRAFRVGSVSIEEFEKRVLSFGFSIPQNFYQSDVFRKGGFSILRGTGMISREASE